VSSKAILALSDGIYFTGNSFGAPGVASGEVVFNTSMTGYQEILTDPSYKGQIVMMTYTQIGNTGINDEDIESVRPHLDGFIVKEYQEIPSNWRAKKSLGEYLKAHRIVGIEGIDTRNLTRHIRDKGAQIGVISTEHDNPNEVINLAKKAPGLIGRDLVKEVTCKSPYKWDQGAWDIFTGYGKRQARASCPKVVAFDLGIKFNILRNMVENGFDVMVVPAGTTAEQVLDSNPDGIFLSNGPGDPEGVPHVIDEVRKLLGRKPIFGICLGHQILGLAFGGGTYKLKFGHHGANHPVKDIIAERIEITTQNHGFAVDKDGLPDDIKITHINLNDHTVEGLAHKDLPVFSVQYHPEASGGPHDARHLFNKFRIMIEEGISGINALSK